MNNNFIHLMYVFMYVCMYVRTPLIDFSGNGFTVFFSSFSANRAAVFLLLPSLVDVLSMESKVSVPRGFDFLRSLIEPPII